MDPRAKAIEEATRQLDEATHELTNALVQAKIAVFTERVKSAMNGTGQGPAVESSLSTPPA